MPEKKSLFGRHSAGIVLRCLAALIVLSAWECLECAEGNWNPAAAARYSQKTGGAVLLIRRQQMLDLSVYEPGYGPQTPFKVFSITKTLTALSCLSLDRPSPGEIVMTGWKSEPITLRHLLSQTSGISPGFEQLYKKNLFDVRKAAASLPQVSRPGEHFEYGPAHYELIGTILKPSGLARDGARQVLTGFLNRLQIHPLDWRTDRQGQIYLSAGLVLTAGDLLKIGKFILDRGNSTGFRPLITREKFEEAFTGSAANPAYGLGFWLNKAAGSSSKARDIEEAIGAHLTRGDWSQTSLSNAAPRDLVALVGSGGQRVYIIPSLRTVVVRLGRPSKFKDPAFLQALFSSRER